MNNVMYQNQAGKNAHFNCWTKKSPIRPEEHVELLIPLLL